MNTGQMPTTDFRYEELVGLLASYHLTLQPLKESLSSEDNDAYDKLMKVLDDLAARHGQADVAQRMQPAGAGAEIHR